MPSLTMNFCAQNILRNQFQKFIFRNTSFFQLSYQKFKNSNGWTKWYQRKLVTFVKLRDHWFSVAKYSSFSVSVFDYHYSRRAGWKHDQRLCYYTWTYYSLCYVSEKCNYIPVFTCKCIYLEYVCSFKCIHIEISNR